MSNDFEIVKYSNVYTLDPFSDRARTWVHENLGNAEKWGTGIVIEPEYILPIQSILTKSGFKYSLSEVHD